MINCMNRIMALVVSFLLALSLFSVCSDSKASGLQWLRLRSKHDEQGSTTFILDEPELAVETDWGEIRVLLRSSPLRKHNVGLGFITMQPKTLLLPHYIDASFVFLVHQGSARLGWIARGTLLQQDLHAGDVYSIPAGTLFYLVSTHDEQDLKVYGAYDTSESVESGKIKSFYVSGESNLFSGFDTELLGAAFKVAEEGVLEFFSAQTKGAIVPTSLDMYKRLTDNPVKYTWRALADFLLNKKAKPSKPLRLFGKKRFFENRNGWFASTYGKKLPLVKRSRLGVQAANLTAGALLAPHWHPQASVVCFVVDGCGSVQISYPNGTNALSGRVERGDAFFIPRYFPVCQLASEESSLQLLGFSVSDAYHKHGHQPQFLTGTNSVLNALDVETLGLSFNMPQELLNSILQAQPDEIILSGSNLQSQDKQ